MTPLPSACELLGPASGACPGSRVLRFKAAEFQWEGVPVDSYKPPTANWCGVERSLLVGGQGETTAFQMRYFAIAPGGFTTLERHRHEHAVVILRGRGQVRLGARVEELSYGDVVYVAPDEVHQLRNLSPSEPLGFLCVVDAERDTPLPAAESPCLKERGQDL